jgi:hypothetical protein
MVGSVPPLQITLLPVNLRHHVDSARIDSAATLIHRPAYAKAGAVESGQEDGLLPAGRRSWAGVMDPVGVFADYARTQRDYPAVTGGDRAITGGRAGTSGTVAYR